MEMVNAFDFVQKTQIKDNKEPLLDIEMHIPIKKLMNENKKNRDKKLADNLRNMLVRIQKRKDVLIKNQKNNNLKLAKLGYKLDIKL